MAALVVFAATVNAQTVGPGGTVLAPGPSTPRDYQSGSTGPGGSAIAPGPAARGIPTEQVGPGGTRMAPGPAGGVSETRAPTRRLGRRAVTREEAETRKPATKQKTRATKRKQMRPKQVRQPVKLRHIKTTTRRVPAKRGR